MIADDARLTPPRCKKHTAYDDTRLTPHHCKKHTAFFARSTGKFPTIINVCMLKNASRLQPEDTTLWEQVTAYTNAFTNLHAKLHSLVRNVPTGERMLKTRKKNFSVLTIDSFRDIFCLCTCKFLEFPSAVCKDIRLPN